MIEGDFKEMGPRSVHNIVNKGGTILKSARSKEFMTVEGRKKAFDNLSQIGVDGLVVIGGDGSFTGAEVFNKLLYLMWLLPLSLLFILYRDCTAISKKVFVVDILWLLVCGH